MSNENLLAGLSREEAARRLIEEGYNELPQRKGSGFFLLLGRVLMEPMLLLLLGAGLIYVFLGELGDALMLLTFIFVVIGITFYQEHKTEKTLEALRNLSSPRALVIRDGKRERIAGREVVRDDLVVVHEGDRVPADGVVLACSNFMIDESLLTGESVSVRKTIWDGIQAMTQSGGDDLPFVYSGTITVSGQGLVRITATGLKTELGKIGKSIGTIREEDTRLHQETKKIVRYFTAGGVLLCLLVFGIYALNQGDIIEGLLTGLTLSMSMIPEEFPVVLVIFLTLGAWRISKRNVLTRRTASIEALGAATVLCVDKTGTLTENTMKLSVLALPTASFDIIDDNSVAFPQEFKELIFWSVLASNPEPFDPIEREIRKVGIEYFGNKESIYQDRELVKEYPFSPEILAVTHVWEEKIKNKKIVAAKGAPEAIGELCHLSEEEQSRIHDWTRDLAQRGLRVIGVAKSESGNDLPSSQHDFSFEFVGLLGFFDPIRESVPASVAEAHNAGIRVIMITGDYPATASWIANQVGIINSDQCILGPDIIKMSDAELREKIRTANVFARVIPEQKLKIVNALKANGEIVAMTGDGVNDAPALKAAHIGIAMGGRGTDVAREASSIVLLDDNFSSIVSAIRLGRRIYDNLKRAMGYICAIHIPIAGITLFPVLFKLPLVLLPAHIAFLELIIDPACSTVFEAEGEDAEIMKRKPRSISSVLLDRRTLILSLIQGVSVFLVVFLIYLISLQLGRGENEARSIAFVALVVGNLMLIVTNLSWKQNSLQILASKNLALRWVLMGGAAALLVVFSIPSLRNIFHFAPLKLVDVLLAILGGLFSLVWFELIKLFWQRRNVAVI